MKKMCAGVQVGAGVSDRFKDWEWPKVRVYNGPHSFLTYFLITVGEIILRILELLCCISMEEG